MSEGAEGGAEGDTAGAAAGSEGAGGEGAAAVVVEKPAAEVVPGVVTGPPEKYELTIPQGSVFDAAALDKVSTIARETGLSNESAQLLLERLSGEATANAESMKPGGDAWKAQESAWRAESLADPEIAGGDEAKFAAVAQKAEVLLKEYGSPELAAYLTETGLGSNPYVLKLFAKIGEAFGESKFVKGSPAAAVDTRTVAQKMYGDDGMGPAAAQ